VNWNTGANWTPTGPPTAGSNLIFPEAASNKTTNNDITAGTAFNSIAITGTGYTLAGNSIQLANSISSTNVGAANVNLALKASTTPSASL